MTDSKEATFVILINHASAPTRKERLGPTTKAKKEASRNKFVEKSGMPDSSKNYPRARLGFVKSIRNGLKKIKNLIKSRPSRVETGLAGRESGVRLQKEE